MSAATRRWVFRTPVPVSIPADSTAHSIFGIRGGSQRSAAITPFTSSLSQQASLVEVGVSFDGADATKPTLLVELIQQAISATDGNPPTHYTIVAARLGGAGSDGHTYPASNTLDDDGGTSPLLDYLIGPGGTAAPGIFTAEPAGNVSIVGPAWYQSPALGAPLVIPWADDEGLTVNNSAEAALVRITNPSSSVAVHASVWMVFA